MIFCMKIWHVLKNFYSPLLFRIWYLPLSNSKYITNTDRKCVWAKNKRSFYVWISFDMNLSPYRIFCRTWNRKRKKNDFAGSKGFKLSKHPTRLKATHTKGTDLQPGVREVYIQFILEWRKFGYWRKKN